MNNDDLKSDTDLESKDSTQDTALPAKKPGKGVYLLPNSFTTASLFAGFYAIVAAMNGDFAYAAIATFVSMVLDGLDGRVARMTNSQSDFGAEYDSLADVVAFGGRGSFSRIPRASTANQGSGHLLRSDPLGSRYSKTSSGRCSAHGPVLPFGHQTLFSRTLTM